MQDILKASVFYRFFASIAAWFGRQWKSSSIISKFLSPVDPKGIFHDGVSSKLAGKLHSFICLVFEKLHLDRAASNSIFKRSFFWCALPMIFAPIVPTMLLAALCAGGIFSAFISFACNRDLRIPYSPLNRFIGLYALVYLLSAFTSVNVRSSLPGALLTSFFIVSSVIFSTFVDTKRKFDLLLRYLMAVGTIVALIGIFQYVFGITGSAAWVDSDKFSDITIRVYSTLGNPNVLGEYLLIVIPFSFALVLTAKNLKSRLLSICAFGIMCLCMVLTFSRGGWLGLLFAAAFFLVILDRRFIILGIFGLIAMYFVLPDTIINRFTSIGDLSDGSTSYRVYIWMGTLAMLSDYWLCGIGPGNTAFNMVYPLYGYNTIAAPHSHNLFLQITCDCGVCGILIFFIIIFVFYRIVGGAIKREKDRDSKIYQIAAFSAATGFFVQSMTDYSFYNYRVMFMFWVLIAVSLIAVRRGTMEER